MKVCGGFLLSCVGVFCAVSAAASGPVAQSARQLPVVRDADVVVVGGGSVAVAAAIAARTNGASVFLAAPRSYLGDDIAGTRELWPAPVAEFATEALARQVFASKIPFSYTASLTPDASHPDPSNTRLTDGVKHDAVNHSVQYNGDVQITLTFQGTGTVTRVDVYYYRRLTSNPFDTTVAGVEYSLDGTVWQAAEIAAEVEALALVGDITTYVSRVTLAGGVRARHLRVSCVCGSGASRQLLDEVMVQTGFEDPLPGSNFGATPLTVKRTLGQALEQAGVAFLGGSPACDILRDSEGRPAGVVLANRKGRQAVTARVVIDATENAWLARQAGAAMTAFVPGAYSFSRIVVSDATNAPAAEGMSVEMLPDLAYAVSVTGVSAPAGMPTSVSGRVYRCTFAAALATGSMLELLEVEQAARDKTWVKTCVDQADRLTWLPPDHIVGQAAESAEAWAGAEALTLDAFRPAGVAHLYVAGVRADVPRALAEAMRNPARMMALGGRIGAAAAAEALARGAPQGVTLPEDPGVEAGGEAVMELLAGLPPVNVNAEGTVAEGARALPVLAECEVLVVGAGTGGAPAAIGAGRAGADTVVVEFLHTMGGVQTDGRIGSYYHGNACGFTVNDVDPGWKATGAVLATAKAEWYRQACRAAGARVLFGTMAAGAVTEGDALKGVVVVLPDGQRGVIRARTVVDATGNADLAAAAGEETAFISAEEPAVQGTGLARHIMGASYNNSDVAFVDTTDAGDPFFLARRAYASMPDNTWDAGQNPASRERRRLTGVVTVTPMDILNGRTWPDTIVRPSSDFDSHGFTVHDLFFVYDIGKTAFTANLPYRALLPKRLDGLLVTGLGISAHRDALPLLRMQRDVQNQGYAAGYASALAVQAQVPVRGVDMAALQAHLVAKGIIGAAHTNMTDNFPLAASAIQTAVQGLTNNYATLHTVLADVATALPLLRAAYQAAAEPAAQLVYAHVLGMLYDPTGAATLAAAVDAGPWDTGWNFRGMGQYGRSVSMMDSYVIALGRTKAAAGVVPVVGKAAQLGSASAFSHVRAAALALEELDGGSAVAVLSSLLASLRGYALTDAAVAPVIAGYSDTAGDTERNHCLKELAVARALYRIGDDAEGNGRQVLEAYAGDPREVYASHARQVLEAGPQSETADGEWTAQALSADWDNASNWRDGQRAGGAGAVALFTNAVAGPQAVSLQGGMASVGALVFGGADRMVAGGVLDISGGEPMVEVAAGTAVTLAADVVAGGGFAKRGAGTLALTGAAALGGLDVAEGDVAFADPDVRFHQAYAAEPSQHNAGAGTGAVSLRTDFRVNSEITVTHLGAYDSAGDGLESFKKVAIYARAGGAPLAALAFAATEAYPLEGGHRMRRLPEPLRLTPGDYAVVTFGFTGDDRYVAAETGGVGARVGAVDDGGGAVTFLTNAYSTAAGALSYPAAVLSGASEYAVSAGSFRFAVGSAVKSVTGPVTLAAGSVLDVAAVDMRLTGGLAAGAGGLGQVTNASAAHGVTLRLGVPGGSTNTLAGGAVGDRPDGTLALVKEGAGTLSLEGAAGFRGGLRVAAGTLEIDSPAALGGGELSFGTGGQLRLRAGGELGRMVYAENQAAANDRSTRLVVPPGGGLTLTRGIEVPRAYEYGGFAIQPLGAAGAGAVTRAVLDGAALGYLDLYLLGDGAAGAGQAEHVWRHVRGAMRKLAAGHETAAGARVTFGEGCDFSANWFDMAGSNAVVSVTNNAFIRANNEVRFVDGNGTQLSLDGGTLRAGVIGVANANNHHLSRTSVLFNGTVVQASRSTDVFFELSAASAAPLIRDGGAVFDTQGYEVAIRGRGFAQAPGSSGAFVKLGAGTLKVAAPMTYTGRTAVSNGTLRLDFALWGGTAGGLLPDAAEVFLAAGARLAVAGQTNAAGAVIHRQALAAVRGGGAAENTLEVSQAELSVNALDGAFVKSGEGRLVLACDAQGRATMGRSMTVQQGTFAVHGAREAVTVAVPYAGFESTPLLPWQATPSVEMDRRGTAATGCPGWVFNSNDAGYQRNGSYFSGTAAAQTTNGVQTAFVRRNASMEAALVFPTNGTYTLRFSHCSRYYQKWYTNQTVKTRIDGQLKDTLVVQNRVFMERTVELGYLEAGTRTLRFEGSVELPTEDNDPCVLIDDVRITGVSAAGEAAGASDSEAALQVMSGARVELDYAGVLEVGVLEINGVRLVGGRYGAATHPEVFSGTGTVKSKSSGTRLLLK